MGIDPDISGAVAVVSVAEGHSLHPSPRHLYGSSVRCQGCTSGSSCNSNMCNGENPCIEPKCVLLKRVKPFTGCVSTGMCSGSCHCNMVMWHICHVQLEWPVGTDRGPGGVPLRLDQATVRVFDMPTKTIDLAARKRRHAFPYSTSARIRSILRMSRASRCSCPGSHCCKSSRFLLYRKQSRFWTQPDQEQSCLS